MTILDTDTFSLLASGHPRVTARALAATDTVTITVITRIEALQGRFAFLLRAADAEELLRAQEWLQQTDANLRLFPIIPFDAAGAAEFDRLRENKKLKKIGRADLLIASIALANRATLVTRNLKDFRQVPGLRVENWAD
jgi:tRNA(fMet)-specific endonuclease VapC